MTTYLDRPLFTILPDFQAVSSGLLDDFTYATQGFGKGTPWKPTALPRRSIRYPFALRRDGVGELRQFASDAAGRRRGFWLPIYLRDYELAETAAAGASELLIRPIGLADALVSFAQFKHLAIATWFGMECHGITAVSAEDGLERVTLDTPLEAEASTDSVMCCGLIYARLADDELSFRFEGTDFARSDAQFVELPAEYDAAHDGSALAFLYKLTRGSSVWRYCGYGADLVIAGQTWERADMTHGEIVHGIDFFDNGVALSVATDDATHPLSALTDRNLLQETLVEIYRADVDAMTADLTSPVYSGKVREVTFTKGGVIEPKLTSDLCVGELQAPTIQFQRTCNLQTYGVHCGLNPATFTTSGTVTALSAESPYIEAAEFDAKRRAEDDKDWFALGRVTIGTEQRVCVGQDGARLYLNAPFSNAHVGDAVSALAGDDKRPATCKKKFGNIDNFFATPWMPNKNPQFEALETPKQKGGKKQ
jgi:hypothetical protein